MRIETQNPEAVVKEAFWLAWQACGGPMGMGVLQNKPTASKDDVWNNVAGNLDYAANQNKPGSFRADYVFGRMMKLRLEWDKSGVTFRDDEPQRDFQSWCRTYPTYRSLIEAAMASINKERN